MLQMIELALETTATGGFCQVMSFIDDDGERLALFQGRFHRFTQFSGTYPRHLPIDKWITQSPQNGAVIFDPLKTIGSRSRSKDTGKGHEAEIGCHQCFTFEQ